jgi:hypothetical protein
MPFSNCRPCGICLINCLVFWVCHTNVVIIIHSTLA